MERVLIVKGALLSEINAQMQSLASCRDFHAIEIVHDRDRISGGNWTMQQFRSSGPVVGEVECRQAIGEFIAELQERYDIAE